MLVVVVSGPWHEAIERLKVRPRRLHVLVRKQREGMTTFMDRVQATLREEGPFESVVWGGAQNDSAREDKVVKERFSRKRVAPLEEKTSLNDSARFRPNARSASLPCA